MTHFRRTTFEDKQSVQAILEQLTTVENDFESKFEEEFCSSIVKFQLVFWSFLMTHFRRTTFDSTSLSHNFCQRPRQSFHSFTQFLLKAKIVYLDFSSLHAIFAKGKDSTVWKFEDFCITEILREINFEDSRSAKCVILTYLEALNFDFYEILQFLKTEIYQSNKIHSP